MLSRQLVGSFDVAVVRENQAGALNGWLEENGYRPLENADDVLDFYRDKNYVFACVKVDDAKLSEGSTVDLHPLRFSFATGGRDGIYFPMKMTGLQAEPFDVNLYVFYKAWINDRLSKFGYEHRGFFAQPLRRHLFQPVDGGIISKDVVTYLCPVHRFPHRWRRMGDSIATQVNDFHCYLLVYVHRL